MVQAPLQLLLPGPWKVGGPNVSSFESDVRKSINIMGVSKNRGTPKWMVYKENPIKMDDLGVPPFLETPISNVEK